MPRWSETEGARTTFIWRSSQFANGTIEPRANTTDRAPPVVLEGFPEARVPAGSTPV